MLFSGDGQTYVNGQLVSEDTVLHHVSTAFLHSKFNAAFLFIRKFLIQCETGRVSLIFECCPSSYNS